MSSPVRQSPASALPPIEADGDEDDELTADEDDSNKDDEVEDDFDEPEGQSEASNCSSTASSGADPRDSPEKLAKPDCFDEEFFPLNPGTAHSFTFKYSPTK